MKILHVSPEELLLKSVQLGKKVYQSGFRPKHAISLWRGGTPVGLGVDLFFRQNGIYINHTTVATSSYHGINQQSEVTVRGLEHVIKALCREDSLLIIDDVYESGNTIETIIQILRDKCRANFPDDIVVATIHRKPDCGCWTDHIIISMDEVAPDVWIDYPHELADLFQVDDPDHSLIASKDREILKLLMKEYHSISDITEKRDYQYLTPSDLLYDSIRLGMNIFNDYQKFYPDFIIALWPGGVNAGLPIHEVYKYRIKRNNLNLALPDHVSLNTTRSHLSYKSNIIGLPYLEEKVNKNDRILIIDTTFRSGRLVNDVIANLKNVLKRNLTVDNIRVASIYYNSSDRSTWTTNPIITRPHYYLKKVDWEIIYPHSIFKLPFPRNILPAVFPELNKILYNG